MIDLYGEGKGHSDAASPTVPTSPTAPSDLRTSYPMKRFILSSAKIRASRLSAAAFRPPALPSLTTTPSPPPLTTRTLSSSASLLRPHFTPPHLQLQQDEANTTPSGPPPPAQEPRPFSEIPRTKTFLGLNVDMLKDFTKATEYMREQADKLGTIFRLTGAPGLPEMVCILDPKDVEAAFRAGDSGYPRRFPIQVWLDARKELNQPTGIFLENGEEWHDHRMPISKFIMMPRKMAEYHGPFNDVASDYIDLVRSQRQQDGLFLDIVGSLNKWSLESVSLFVLGKRMGCLEDQMPQECKEFVENIHDFTLVTAEMFFGIPFHRLWRNSKWKRLVKSMDGMFMFTRGHIDKKIKEIEEGSADGTQQAELGMDFLTYMIHSGKMSVHTIAVNAIDLLTAGVDTTSMTVAGCLYSLATNPEVQEKLRREVQDVVGKEEVVTPQHIQDMHYLRDVIKETMRLYPIAPNNSRILSEDVVLGGYKVPAETTLIMPILVAGKDPKYFPDPNSFKPERWDRGNKELPNHFMSLPFGYGRRSCLGRRVAELEMYVLLSQVIRKFKIEYREKEPLKFNTKLFYGPARRMDLAFTDLD